MTPKTKNVECVNAKFLEVKIEETSGDATKLIKKFSRKVKKEEILKPCYERMKFFLTKSQRRRKKRLKSIYEHKKRQESEDVE